MAAALEPKRLADAQARHAQEVEELRGRLAAACPGREPDDLFLLRYVLSYEGGGPGAAAAAARAIAWREKHRGLVAAAQACTDELASEPLKEWISLEHLRVIDSCLVARFAGQTSTPQGFPLYVIHSGRCRLRKLMDTVDIKSVALWLTWRNEIGYWRCDAATRRSGLLMKQVVVMSMEGALMSGQDPRFFVSYGKSSKRSEYLHPQLLARQVVVHPPAYMSYLWGLGRRLVSERLLAKVLVHSGPPEEHLREYFGGGALPAPLLAALRAEAGPAAPAEGGAPASGQPAAAAAPHGAPPHAAEAESSSDE